MFVKFSKNLWKPILFWYDCCPCNLQDIFIFISYIKEDNKEDIGEEVIEVDSVMIVDSSRKRKFAEPNPNGADVWDNIFANASDNEVSATVIQEIFQ